jgi:hypothetical protein
MRKQTIGGWRKLHSEELQNLYFSSDIVRVIKSRWLRLVGRHENKSSIRKPEGNNHLEE